MKCNLECPYAKPNGRDRKGNQSIICECRNWFMTDADDCIQNYDKKTISQIKCIFKVPTPHYEKFKVMTEIPTNKKTITNRVTGNDLTLEDACDLLNKQDIKIQQIKTILLDMLEETFNDRMKYDDKEHLIEYFKGRHTAIGDIKKKIFDVINE